MLKWVHIVVNVERIGHWLFQHLLLYVKNRASNFVRRSGMFDLDHYLADKHTLNPAYGWSVGTKNPFAEDLAKSFGHLYGEVVEKLPVPVLEIDVDKSEERRIIEGLTL